MQALSDKVKEGAEDTAFITDEIVVAAGEPAEEILKVAEDRNCDLIVMGSHGMGGIVGMLVGSTARKVVRESRKPVLVVRLPE